MLWARHYSFSDALDLCYCEEKVGGTPGIIRKSDPQLRRLPLYPAELQGQSVWFKAEPVLPCSARQTIRRLLV